MATSYFIFPVARYQYRKKIYCCSKTVLYSFCIYVSNKSTLFKVRTILNCMLNSFLHINTFITNNYKTHFRKLCICLWQANARWLQWFQFNKKMHFLSDLYFSIFHQIISLRVSLISTWNLGCIVYTS